MHKAAQLIPNSNFKRIHNPAPSESERSVEDSKCRTCTLKVLVRELERHNDYVDLYDDNRDLHPLIRQQCKKYIRDRPASQELCHHLSSLKESPQYIESEQCPGTQVYMPPEALKVRPV